MVHHRAWAPAGGQQTKGGWHTCERAWAPAGGQQTRGAWHTCMKGVGSSWQPADHLQPFPSWSMCAQPQISLSLSDLFLTNTHRM